MGIIEIYSYDNYSFSFTQADKAFDVVFASEKCPKCNSDFAIYKKRQVEINQSQNAIADNNTSQRAHNYYDFIQGPQRKP